MSVYEADFCCHDVRQLQRCRINTIEAALRLNDAGYLAIVRFRSIILIIMWPLAVAAVLGLVAASTPVSYDGYQVLRVKTGTEAASVQQKLSSIKFDEWNTVVNKHIDIAISPDQVARFRDLGLDYHVMHEDLGISITTESTVSSSWKRQVDDLSWYDSYHPYDDHKAYFEALHKAFPNNSEIVSSGTSYEGRDIFGIHFWGADGPGKPAVLWHGTVHAREWISAPVSHL